MPEDEPRPLPLCKRFFCASFLEIAGLLLPAFLSAFTPRVSLAKDQGPANSVQFPTGEGTTGLAWNAIIQPKLVTDQDVLRLLSHGNSGPSSVPPALLLYALFQLRDGAERRAITQYFQRVATSEADVVSDPSKVTFRLTPALVTEREGANRQRAIALRALARTTDPTALAQVVSAAMSDDSLAGWDPIPAREALLDLPSLRGKLAPLAPLLNVDHFIVRLHASEQKLPSSPLALVRAARQDPTTLGPTLRRVARALEAGARPVPGQDTESLPAGFVDPKAWESALIADPLWTLRISALLNSQLPTRVLRRVANYAESHAQLPTRSGEQVSSALTRRAAAWALPIINDALGRSSRLTPRSVSPMAPNATVETWSVKRWADISTRTFWSLYQHKRSPAVVAALCSRLQEDSGEENVMERQSSAPSLHQVRLWVSSTDALVRGACALGLSVLGASIGTPLLIARYFDEDSPLVRSAITRALRLALSPDHPLLRSIALLDPDQDVRLQAARHQTSSLFVLSFSPSPVTVLAVSGQSYRLVPEADGFAALVDIEK